MKNLIKHQSNISNKEQLKKIVQEMNKKLNEETVIQVMAKKGIRPEEIYPDIDKHR